MAMSVLVVLTVAFTIWALVYIMARGSETTRLAFIMKKKIEKTVPCSVAFIDQCDTIRAPAQGILVPLVEEGTRVAKGDRVAMIVPAGHEEEVGKFLAANESYYTRRSILAGLKNVTEDALPKTRSDSLMREAILSLSRVSIVGDLSAFQSAMRHLRKAQIEYRGESLQVDGDTELTELRRERDRLLDHLETFAVKGGFLAAPSPGTVSFYVSRSDEVSDENKWREIADPKAEIERLAAPSSQPTDSRQNLVAADMPVARVSNVAANTMVAVIPHDPDEETRLKRGDTVDLIVSSDLRLDRCRVTGVRQGEEVDAIFLTAPAVLELSMRLTAVTDALMTVESLTGPAVPVRSLIDYCDDALTARLKKVEKGVTKTIAVRVLICDGTYAVIEHPEGLEPLREAELYVVNPWTIGEGLLIE